MRNRRKVAGTSGIRDVQEGNNQSLLAFGRGKGGQ